MIQYAAVLIILACSACSCQKRVQSAEEEGCRRFLLLDSRIISDTDNTILEVGSVEKHDANPLFEEDKSWEMRFDNLYGNVIYDEEEKLYKCWYSPFIVDHSAKGMTLKERETDYPEGKGIKREMGICYAISMDGIEWEKPNLGLVEYNGSRQNNIVWRGPQGAGIFKDLHEKDPARRYKMIYRGINISFSADGIHWSDKIKIEGVNAAGDTHNNALWAPSINKYVGITRMWGKELGREVARIESDDFINWTKEEVVLKGFDKDLQPYAMPTFYYAGVYLGLAAIHQQSSDRVWTELTWSPDTKKWHRISPGTPLIPNSQQKLDYDYGCVYACAYPVFKNEEILLYYGGSDWLHYGWRSGSLCLAKMRPDGFAGYTPQISNMQASLTTTPIAYNGQSIRITADIEEGGFLKTIVLDQWFVKLLSGHSAV